MASRQSQQFQHGAPLPPPHGRRYAPGIQGPRPQPARGRTGSSVYDGPIYVEGPMTPGFSMFDEPSTLGAPRRGPAARGGRRGSDLSLVPCGKKQGKPKQNKRNGVAPGAIASPVALFKEFGNALESAPRAPKSFNFHTTTSLGRKGVQHQSINASAKWESRSGSISSDDSNLELIDAAMGGAMIGAAVVGEMMDDFSDSQPSARKNSNSSSSSSGSVFEMPGGVSLGGRDSIRSSVTSFGPGSSTAGSARPGLKGKQQRSSTNEFPAHINELAKPRAGAREDSVARINKLNNRNHLKKLNMGNRPRANQANSSKSRQPRADSVAEGSFYY